MVFNQLFLVYETMMIQCMCMYSHTHMYSHVLTCILILNAVEVDTAYAEFLSIFSEQYNICCPVKTIRAQVARRDKPWITNGLKNACRKKNRLYKIWLHSQTPAAESR